MKNIYKMSIRELEDAVIEESRKYGKEYDGGLSELRWIRFFKNEHRKGIEYSEMLKKYLSCDDKYSKIAVKVLKNLKKYESNKTNKINDMTNKERVLNYINEFGSITTLDSIRDLGYTRLSDGIYRLKKDGIPIKDRIEHGKNRWGEDTIFKRYYIDENRLPKEEVKV